MVFTLPIVKNKNLVFLFSNIVVLFFLGGAVNHSMPFSRKFRSKAEGFCWLLVGRI